MQLVQIQPWPTYLYLLRAGDIRRIELDAEWNYRYEERLGILCGADRPTPAQRQLAAREADEAIEKLAHSDFGLTTAKTRPFDCP